MTMKTADRARRKWRGILLSLGVDEKFLRSKHGPCPFCEGTDRFRWDDKDGKGTFFCSHCGAGDGIEFVKRFKGWDFKTAVREIDAVIGGVTADPPKRQADPQKQKDQLARLWNSGVPLQLGDPACVYLEGRGALPAVLPTCLRFVERCPVPFENITAPAMLALVRGVDGGSVNIHRTFLIDPKRGEKRLRAMMPGEHPAGSAVRLAPPVDGKLGIAEGIETALKAAKRFNVPTWAALNAGALERWELPEGVTELVVFGDCDPKFGGQQAAFTLAHRVATRKRIPVEVYIPQDFGTDWADDDAR